MELELKITFPIVKSYSSEQYALIIVDSAGVTHYWDFDGAYDGFSSDPSVDWVTRTNMN